MTRMPLESLAGRKTPWARRNRRARRPEVEAVEARCLLATVVWDLSGNGNWNTAANWLVESTGPPVHRVPTATDDVSIPGTSSQAVIVTLSSAASVHSLNVTNAAGDNTLALTAGGSLTIGSGEDSPINTLHLSQGATINVPADAVMAIGDGSIIAGTVNVAATGTFDFGGGGSGIDIDAGTSLAGAGQFAAPDGFGTLRINTPMTLPQNFEVGSQSATLVLNANVTTGQDFTVDNGQITGPGSITVPSGDVVNWLAGTIGNAGGMTNSSGATLDLPGAGSSTLDTGTLTNRGTINWSGQGPFNGNHGATIVNDAAFNISGDGGSSSLTINNAGTIVKTSPVASGITGLWDILNNTGTVDVNSGTLGLNAGGPGPVQVEAGAFNVAAGAVLAFNSTYYGGDTGDVQINAGTQLAGAGLFEFDHGTLSIDTNLSVAHFTQTGGTVNGPGALTVTGTFNWTGGDIDGTGTTTVARGATLAIGGPNTVNLTGGHTLNLAGNTTWSGSSSINGNGGSTINNSGSFAIQNDGSSSGLIFDNSGTITKASPVKTGTTGIWDLFNNTGTVDVNSGTLGLFVGGPNPIQVEAGTFNVASGAVLDFNSTYYGGDAGDVQIIAGTQLAGAGLYQFDHGTLSIDTNVSVAHFTQTGGTVNGPGTLTVTGAFNWTGGDIDGTGTTAVAKGGTFAMGGPNNLSLTGGHVLNNAGSATWSGIAQLNGNGGSVFDNSGTFAIASDSSSDGVVFNNSGTTTKTSPTGSGTTTIGSSGWPFNNSGTVNIQSGVLALDGGGADSSLTFNVAAGAELSIGLDRYGYAVGTTLTGTVSLLGAGMVVLDGGDLSAGTAGATLLIGSTTTLDWSSGTIAAPVGSTFNLDGTLALIGTSNEVLSGGGTVNLVGTMTQSGSGKLVINGTATTATTFSIAGGSTYTVGAASGIVQGSNDGGVVNNLGTLRKAVGLGTSTIGTPLSNTGTISVTTGTLDVTGAVGQVIGTTLEGGTWIVISTPKIASTLTFAAPTSLSALGVGAVVTLSGPNSAFTNLAGLTSNAGSLALQGGASFATAGAFTNTGTLTLGAGDALDVAGKYTQTATATMAVTIAGTSANGQWGRIVATGSASMAGTLDVTVPSSFSPTVGDSYAILGSSGDSGTFATIDGLALPNSKVLTPSYGARTFTLTVGTAASPAAVVALVSPAATVVAPSVALVSPAASSSSPGGASEPAQPASPSASSSGDPAATPEPAAIVQAPQRHPGHARPFHTLIRTRGHGTRPTHTPRTTLRH